MISSSFCSTSCAEDVNSSSTLYVSSTVKICKGEKRVCVSWNLVWLQRSIQVTHLQFCAGGEATGVSRIYRDHILPFELHIQPFGGSVRWKIINAVRRYIWRRYHISKHMYQSIIQGQADFMIVFDQIVRCDCSAFLICKSALTAFFSFFPPGSLPSTSYVVHASNANWQKLSWPLNPTELVNVSKAAINRDYGDIQLECISHLAAYCGWLTLYSLDYPNIKVLLLCGDGLKQDPHGIGLIVVVPKVDCCYFKLHLPICTRVTVGGLNSKTRITIKIVYTSGYSCFTLLLTVTPATDVPLLALSDTTTRTQQDYTPTNHREQHSSADPDRNSPKTESE